MLHLLADPGARTMPVRELPTELLIRHTTASAPTPTTQPSGQRRSPRR
jgi:hypothetical protein